MRMLISTFLPLEVRGAQAARNCLTARGISDTRWRQTEAAMRVPSCVPTLLESLPTCFNLAKGASKRLAATSHLSRRYDDYRGMMLYNIYLSTAIRGNSSMACDHNGNSYVCEWVRLEIR